MTFSVKKQLIYRQSCQTRKRFECSKGNVPDRHSIHIVGCLAISFINLTVKMKLILYSAAFIAFVATTLDAAGGFRGRRPNLFGPGRGRPGGRKNATKLLNCSDDGNHTKFRNRTHTGHH